MGNVNSGERTATELFLFAVGFLAFLFFAGGIATASAPVTVFGAILLLLVVFCFRVRGGPDE